MLLPVDDLPPRPRKAIAMNTISVDAYLQDGCGRCDHYRLPTCKVHRWTDILVALRRMLAATDLVEEMKWGSPCYTLGGKNVVMLASFRESCGITFVEGLGLHDPEGLLEKIGPNTRVPRMVRFRSPEDLERSRAAIARLIDEAIAQERAGIRHEAPPEPEPIPDELAERLDGDPDLQDRFLALTPGRRRSHILHIGSASKTETRRNRVEKCVPLIRAGKGFNER
jgi:uncharacterized protein YdeI (YjbR/CyaY-like superfamily)